MFPSIRFYPVRAAIGSITAGQVIARVPHYRFVVARDKLLSDGGVCRIQRMGTSSFLFGVPILLLLPETCKEARICGIIDV